MTTIAPILQACRTDVLRDAALRAELKKCTEQLHTGFTLSIVSTFAADSYRLEALHLILDSGKLSRNECLTTTEFERVLSKFKPDSWRMQAFEAVLSRGYTYPLQMDLGFILEMVRDSPARLQAKEPMAAYKFKRPENFLPKVYPEAEPEPMDEDPPAVDNHPIPNEPPPAYYE